MSELALFFGGLVSGGIGHALLTRRRIADLEQSNASLRDRVADLEWKHEALWGARPSKGGLSWESGPPIPLTEADWRDGEYSGGGPVG